MNRGVVISVKKHSDKKPLEVYDKDSARVHRWFSIEFTDVKLNYVIMWNDQISKCKQKVIIVSVGLDIVFSKCNGSNFSL